MRMFMKRFVTATAVVATGLMAWATLAPQALAAEPIRIGVMAPKAHIDGRAIFHAAKLAAENINDNGGINGRKIKLYTYDTKFSASVASRAFQRAVQQDDVVAVVGLFTSEVSLAMMPWASRLKTPLIITGAASSAIPNRIRDNYERYKYVFHGYINSAVIAKATCITSKKMFSQNPKLDYYNRAVIFAEDAKWTQSVIPVYKKCLPKAGFNVVDTVVFSTDTTDFRPIFSQIEQAGGNIIMAAIAHVGVKPVVQWRHQHVPALFAGANGQAGSSVFWKATNGATEGVITGNVGASGVPLTTKVPAFYKAYTEQFGVEQPAYDAYTTYDAIYALKHAIQIAGSTDADALINGLEKVNFTGVSGQIHYYGKDGKWPHEVVFNINPAKGMSFVVIQWQNGKQVVVWPDRLAQGKMIIPPFVPQPSK